MSATSFSSSIERLEKAAATSSVALKIEQSVPTW
jgi:hypothetical protein